MASIRDLTCIRSVQHMAEYGKYDEEFIVYGCSCLEHDKRVFRVSTSFEEIAAFVNNAAWSDVYPSPIQMLMERCVVQTGQREYLQHETQLKLANKLKETYTKEFFDLVQQCAAVEANDQAKELFDALEFEMSGIFRKDYLQLMQGLLEIAYKAKAITPKTLREIQSENKKISKQMDFDTDVKRPFSRTFFGICYISAGGGYQYKINAQEFLVLEEQRKLKQKGIPVTPIFRKTYWYDYGVEPKTIKEQFKKELTDYYDDIYWDYWFRLKRLPAAVSAERYAQALAVLEQKSGAMADAFREYGYDWNLAAPSQN